MTPIVQRQARSVIGVLCLALTLPGCRDSPPTSDRVWLDLADEVWHQAGNVTTDLISASPTSGLESLSYGWRQVQADDPDRAAFEMSVSVSRLSFFSADGDMTAFEIEVSFVGKGKLRQTPLTLVLNDKRLVNLPLTRQWERHRVEVPSEVVRKGNNHLDLRFLHPGHFRKWRHRPRPRVRSLQMFASNGRSPWPARPTSISLVDTPSSTPVPSTIQMPSPGWLEVFAELPERARLRASFRIQGPPAADRHPVLVYGRLLDQQLEEHHLAQRRVTETHKDHHFDVDLNAWKGQTVRLRIGVGGPGNAVVTWHWAVVEGPPGEKRSLEIETIRQQQPTASGRLGRPDVLVILLDAARADAFPPFGGTRPTPAIERLAEEGTHFDQALAASSWTGQSVSSIFTGFFPDTLGVATWGSPLPSDIATMAELLSRAGYRTVLWTQHPFYDQQADLKRGFQEFYRPAFQDYATLPSQEMLFSEKQPSFAFVHLIPPHTPYSPPNPYRGRYSSWYTGSVEPNVKFLRTFRRRRNPDELTAEDRRFIRDRYDENVAFADAQVGSLLSMLDFAERYEDTLIILLSDHGEAFLEHERYLHSNMLHWEFLHVPLVIKWPQGVLGYKAEVADPISLVDLVPTLVDGLALPDRLGGYQGRSLIPLAFDSAIRPDPLWATTRRVASYQQPPRPQQMLQAGPWKILFDPLTEESQLFQVEDDPAETQDLSEKLPMRTMALRQALQRQAIFNRKLLRESDVPPPIEGMDAELEEQLEALGYVN